MHAHARLRVGDAGCRHHLVPAQLLVVVGVDARELAADLLDRRAAEELGDHVLVLGDAVAPLLDRDDAVLVGVERVEERLELGAAVLRLQRGVELRLGGLGLVGVAAEPRGELGERDLGVAVGVELLEAVLLEDVDVELRRGCGAALENCAAYLSAKRIACGAPPG